MEFRIGINLGDVIVDGEQIYGDGVNLAARLQSLAEPGGIYISGSVHEQIGNKLTLSYVDLGERSVKNIAKPVRVFRLLPATVTSVRRTPQELRGNTCSGVSFRSPGLGFAATTIVVQHLSLRPPTPSASTPPARSSALSLPDKPSIAVLPFVHMNGDRDQEYFSDGITNDIITELSRSPDLFVIDRASTFTYKGKPVRVQQVSRELGVKYVLEGGVQKAGHDLRITAQLVDATTGAEVWAARYDRPLSDIFSLQDEIVRKIVTTMGLQLNLWDQTGLTYPRGTNNLEAYDSFLRGQEFFLKSSKEGNAKARQMFEKAVQQDPDNADAYAGLGSVYALDRIFQSSDDPQLLDRAYQMAQKAIALDESNPLAYMLLGSLDLMNRRYDQAISEGQRAVELGPNLADGYFWLSRILTFSVRPRESIVTAEKGMRLDPRHPELFSIQMRTDYLIKGRFGEALERWKDRSVMPNDPSMSMWRAIAYVELGRVPEARREAAEVLRLSPSYSLAQWRQVYPLRDSALQERYLADLRIAGLK
jgi:adenylate cyclase